MCSAECYPVSISLSELSHCGCLQFLEILDILWKFIGLPGIFLG